MSLPITPEDLMSIILEANKPESPVSFGMVMSVITGDDDAVLGATIKFEGEETTGTVQYVPLSRYTPSVGDRVMLLRAGHTAVIVDKVGHV